MGPKKQQRAAIAPVTTESGNKDTNSPHERMMTFVATMPDTPERLALLQMLEQQLQASRMESSSSSSPTSTPSPARKTTGSTPGSMGSVEEDNEIKEKEVHRGGRDADFDINRYDHERFNDADGMDEHDEYYQHSSEKLVIHSTKKNLMLRELTNDNAESWFNATRIAFEGAGLLAYLEHPVPTSAPANIQANSMTLRTILLDKISLARGKNGSASLFDLVSKHGSVFEIFRTLERRFFPMSASHVATLWRNYHNINYIDGDVDEFLHGAAKARLRLKQCGQSIDDDRHITTILQAFTTCTDFSFKSYAFLLRHSIDTHKRVSSQLNADEGEIYSVESIEELLRDHYINNKTAVAAKRIVSDQHQQSASRSSSHALMSMSRVENNEAAHDHHNMQMMSSTTASSSTPAKGGKNQCLSKQEYLKQFFCRTCNVAGHSEER